MADGTPLRRHIVLVAHSHVVGGIERLTLEWARGLRGRGFEVTFAGPRDGWLGEHMRDAGHRCLHLPMHGMYDFWSAWKLARYCRREKVWLVHGLAQRGGRYAAWAARRAGIAFIVSAHSTNAWRWFEPGATILTVASAVREMLLTHGFPPERLHVVYTGLQDPGQRPLPVDPLERGEPLTLVMLSRIEPVKGHDLALEALREIDDQLACRLVIFGPDDTAWASELRARATSLGVAGRVEFRGATECVGEALGLADVVLAPSRREALSLTLIETAAVGRPAIVSDVGGNGEVVLDGRTGLLFPAGDAQSLAEAILRVGRDAGLRFRMAKAARERFEENFTMDAMLDGTLRVYESASRLQASR